jgi:hypothetical protein
MPQRVCSNEKLSLPFLCRDVWRVWECLRPMFAHFVVHVPHDVTRPCSKVVERYEEIPSFQYVPILWYVAGHGREGFHGGNTVDILDWYFSLITSRTNRIFRNFPYSLQFNSWVVIWSTPRLFPFRFTILNQPHLAFYTILSFVIGVVLLNSSSILRTYEPCFTDAQLSRYLRS